MTAQVFATRMEAKRIYYVGHSASPGALFPLTPALTLGKRILQRDSRFGPLNRPLSGLRHPLPLRGGEGKGEGAVSIASRFRGREQRGQPPDASPPASLASALATVLPAPEPPLARDLPMIPPLPFRRGEGRGEGSGLRFMGAKRVKMSGSSLPKGEGRGEGETDARPTGAPDVSTLPFPH